MGFVRLYINAAFHVGLSSLFSFQKLLTKLTILRAGGRSRCKLKVSSHERPKLPAEKMGLLRLMPASLLEEENKKERKTMVSTNYDKLMNDKHSETQAKPV